MYLQKIQIMKMYSVENVRNLLRNPLWCDESYEIINIFIIILYIIQFYIGTCKCLLSDPTIQWIS